jgi:hypothetical protein
MAALARDLTTALAVAALARSRWPRRRPPARDGRADARPLAMATPMPACALAVVS